MINSRNSRKESGRKQRDGKEEIVTLKNDHEENITVVILFEERKQH